MHVANFIMSIYHLPFTSIKLYYPVPIGIVVSLSAVGASMCSEAGDKKNRRQKTRPWQEAEGGEGEG